MRRFGLAVVVALAAMSSAITSRITAPLQALTARRPTSPAATGRVACRSRGATKSGELSAAFNRMADQIQQVNRTLTDVNDRTEFALDAAQMGIGEMDVDSDAVTSFMPSAACSAAAASDVPATMQAFLARDPSGRSGQRAGHRGARAAQSARRSVGRRSAFSRPDDRCCWLDARARLFFNADGPAAAGARGRSST